MRTRIKICGLTREQDVDAAVEAGVDAVGFVFYDKSPRAVSADAAAAMIRRLPPWMAAVGLFVNAQRETILQIADQAGLTHLQLHGDEPPEACLRLGRPVVKAIRVRTGLAEGEASMAETSRLIGLVRAYADCHALLFDADSEGFGGSGRSFDWDLLANVLADTPERRRTWVLSGGLESGSVGQALARLGPVCVDVSSGVELLQDGRPCKGVKDPARIRAFAQAVQVADADRISALTAGSKAFGKLFQ
jgi:phosphoribosylanthranilate isomerase